jgi:hypothetical protein
MLSLFLRSFTNCGNKSGLSFGDISARCNNRWRRYVSGCEAYRELKQSLKACYTFIFYFLDGGMLVWNSLFKTIRGQGLLERSRVILKGPRR